MIRFIYKYVCAALIATAALTACSDEVSLDDNWQPSLSPHQVEFSVSDLTPFEHTGGSKTLTVTSTIDWTIVDKPDFVTITPASGATGTTTVTVTASPNTGSEPRSGEITFGYADAKVFQDKVHVEQGYPIFSSSGQTVTVTSTAGNSHQITLTANQDWIAAFSQGTWAHVTPASGSGTAILTIMADDNPSIKQREDVLTIMPAATKKPLTFRLIQKGKFLTVNTTELVISPYGGTSDSVTITTDGTYSVTTSGDWLTLNQNGKTFTVTATTNKTNYSRTGSITVSLINLPSGESYSKVISVSQFPACNIEGEGFGDDQNWNF